MSNFSAPADVGCFATSKCVSEPILRGSGKSDYNLPKCIARNTDLAASDWRAEAEAGYGEAACKEQKRNETERYPGGGAVIRNRI
jgi:hypothetical protein